MPTVDPALLLACCTHPAFVSLDAFLLNPAEYRLVWCDPVSDEDLMAEGALGEVCQVMAHACRIARTSTLQPES